MFFILYTFNEYGDKVIMTMATEREDCVNDLSTIKKNYQDSGYKFPEKDYHIEKVEIKKGIFWSCD